MEGLSSFTFADDSSGPLTKRLVNKMQDVNGFSMTVVGLMFLFALHYLLSPKLDPREPPLAPAGIPVIGHVIGFMRNSFKYYGKLHEKLGLPIFTISMPGRKIYVITKPDLISRVDRKNKAISFAPIISEFSSVTCGTSNEATRILNDNLLGEHGNWGLCEDMVVGMREALKPGPNLDKMNKTMAAEICDSLNAIKPVPGQKFRPLQLWSWVTEVVTMATTNSVYGPHNPYKNQEIKDAFWTYEKGIMLMLVSPFPSKTLRESIKARDKVTETLGTYFAERHFEQGSGLAKARFDYSVKNKVPIADIGRFEIGGTIAILVNTLPSVYWMLLMVHVVPGLLEELRSEIDAALLIDEKTKKITIDITTVKNQCPLLLSTLKESLRFRGMGTAVRTVVQDTEIDGYLLKKGALVQIPIEVAHSDKLFWGPDATSFNARRFVKEVNPETGPKKIPDDTGYRAFGGGKHLCPGRFFATNEILAVVALFVSRYEMRPSSGEWHLPTTYNSNAAAQVATPDYELDMEVTNRAGFEEYDWNIELKPSNKVVAVMAGDST